MHRKDTTPIGADAAGLGAPPGAVVRGGSVCGPVILRFARRQISGRRLDLPRAHSRGFRLTELGEKTFDRAKDDESLSADSDGFKLAISDQCPDRRVADVQKLASSLHRYCQRLAVVGWGSPLHRITL